MMAETKKYIYVYVYKMHEHGGTVHAAYTHSTLIAIMFDLFITTKVLYVYVAWFIVFMALLRPLSFDGLFLA